MKKALLVVDIQNEYFKGGNLELFKPEEALKNANALIDYARNEGYEIYVIQHFSLNEDIPIFLPNSNGSKLHKDLDVQSEVVITKNYPNSFRDTNLQAQLIKNDIEELIICGSMSHVCIDSTVRAAFDLGYKVTLAHDACATRDLEFNGLVIEADKVHGSYMSALAWGFCDVKSTNEIIN